MLVFLLWFRVGARSCSSFGSLLYTLKKRTAYAVGRLGPGCPGFGWCPGVPWQDISTAFLKVDGSTPRERDLNYGLCFEGIL